jgi:hypothetical protein
MRYALGLFFVSALAACPRSQAPRVSPDALITTAEASGYVRTGRYAEVEKLCRDFASAFGGVFCDELGRTAQDRPILALRVERRPNLPVIYIQAGIHAGEIEGKDAGFAFLRDLLAGKIAPGALDAVSVVFVPVINPDGHERFGPNHRPNQRGPEEMGFRVNGTRLNINRDFMKADTQEMHGVLQVMRTRDPVLLIDLHTTDGAKFEHDIALMVEPVPARTDELDETATAFRGALLKRMTELGHLPVSFYPAFRDDEDPLSGFEIGDAPPRFSQMYAAARGRLGLLVETHSWRPYIERSASTYHTLQAVFEQARTQATLWRKVADDASRSEARLAGTKLPIMWKATSTRTEIEFRGYAFEKRTSELSGGVWLVYDEKTPQIWKVPLYEEVEPAITIDVPRGGYVIDGGFAKQLTPILDRHGIQHVAIAGQPKLAVEVFRATAVKYQPPFENRTRAVLEGTWATETRTLDRGARFVPIAQPLARLVLHFLEPALPDSFAQWGFFNAAYEQKEYMEPYVVEEQARVMLAKDPKLRERFDAAVARDPELAKSPQKKLQWFYKQHPAWDERVNLVPVYRLDHTPPR